MIRTTQIPGIEIKFSKVQNRDFYYPGDEVSGIVELIVDKKIKDVKGLKLMIIGISECCWKRGKGKKKIKFEGSQKFIDFVTYFFGRENGEPIDVSVGIHQYKFSCRIPLNAVSSYDGTHGSTKYKVSVKLDIPFIQDVIVEKSFSVVRMENLNDFPWVYREVETEDEHCVTGRCCETLPFLLTMKVQKTGYALGESIYIDLKTHNQGQARFLRCMLSLDRVETCYSQKPILNSVRTRKVITYLNLKNLEPFELCTFKEILNIPKELAIVSCEKICEVVKISYEVKYTAYTSKNFVVEDILPITIGHLPYTLEDGNNLGHISKNASIAGSSESVDELSKVCNTEGMTSKEPSPSKWTFVV